MHLKEKIFKLNIAFLGFRVDLYFYEHKLPIEVDELDHCDRNIDYEIKEKNK